MRILITGSNGYIANNLNKYLTSYGHSVLQVSVREGVSSINCTGYDTVIHCAAVVHKKEKNYTQEYYDKYNYLLTVDLAKKAKAEGVPYFIFISSMSVYGMLEGAINKSTKTEPTTKYGKSKLKAENAILKLEDGSFKIAIIRPPMVYGRGCPGNYNALKKLSKLCAIFPKVDNKKSMIYIDNLCEGINSMLLNSTTGTILIQDKEYVNTSRLFEAILASSGKRVRLSPFLGYIAQKINLKIFKKVFGSLYYEYKDCTPISKVDFLNAIMETEKN